VDAKAVRADGTRWKIDAFIIARSFGSEKQRERDREKKREERNRGDRLVRAMRHFVRLFR